VVAIIVARYIKRRRSDSEEVSDSEEDVKRRWSTCICC
jgi:hypothetical protein